MDHDVLMVRALRERHSPYFHVAICEPCYGVSVGDV